MSKEILNNAVQALSEAGIPARRAMSTGKMESISSTVATIAMESADIRNKTVTVLATVLTPSAAGAAACEEAALDAGEVLAALGGKCSTGQCRFDGRSGLFSVEITAQFASQKPKITINGVELQHVLAFTSWRTLDEEVTDWAHAKWNFRLEEYFPMGAEEEADPVEAFTLTHVCESGTESYLESTWTYQRRVWDASGVRQIRLGVAEETDVG